MRLFIPLIVVLLFSCKTTETTIDYNKPIMFIELKSGTNGDFVEPENRIIKNQIEFAEIWEKAFSNFTDKETVPEIDFKTKWIVFVTMGQKNSGGFSIKVDKLVEDNNQLTITVLETSPGKSCVTTEALTFPYQIVEIEKTNKKIIFEPIGKSYDCD